MFRVKDGLVTTSGRMTTASGKPYMKNGKHSGGGSLGEGCHSHWPSYDFTKPQVCSCRCVWLLVRYSVALGEGWPGADQYSVDRFGSRSMVWVLAEYSTYSSIWLTQAESTHQHLVDVLAGVVLRRLVLRIAEVRCSQIRHRYC